MLHKKLKKKKKYLKSLGFKVESLNDGSAGWFVKKIKNTFLLGYAEIIVQDFNDKLILSIDTIDKESPENYHTTVYIGKYKKKKLKKILKLLK
jgi:hypothetical protein